MKCKFCNFNLIKNLSFGGAYTHYCNSCKIDYWAHLNIISDCMVNDYCIFFKDTYIDIAHNSKPTFTLVSTNDLSKLGTCNARDFLNRYLALKAFF